MRRAALVLPIALAIATGCPLEPLPFPPGVSENVGGAGGAASSASPGAIAASASTTSAANAGGAGGAPSVASASAASSTASGGCSDDSMCDDGNPCTDDRCEAGACVFEPAPAGTSCADENPCDGEETCDGAAQCEPGVPLDTDDGNPCTFDGCDPATGNPTHTKNPSCFLWKQTPIAGAPEPRLRHTAVWTGKRMIVWGGSVAGNPSITATGGVYDPESATWKPTSMAGAPPPRHSHAAVWTGKWMIVWGGFGASTYEITGGRYDPESDSWAAMSTVGAPKGRTDFTAVWTGKEMIVWGGLGPSTIGTGGRYDPVADTWTPLPVQGGPSPRFGHSAIFTGESMIVWGGNDFFDWHQDGWPYHVASVDWLPPTPLASAPERREAHSAAWTGSAMLIWGGWNGGVYLSSGGVLSAPGKAGSAWTAMSDAGAPSARAEHAAIWTGADYIVWGGCGGDGCTVIHGDGGRWTPGPGGGSWAIVPATPFLAARRGPTAVWTGKEILLWGGRTSGGQPTNTGAHAVP